MVISVLFTAGKLSLWDGKKMAKSSNEPLASDAASAPLEQHEVDVYRDTWVRYLGYANELGESFRPLIPRSVVVGTYVIAFGYVAMDTYDKSSKFYERVIFRIPPYTLLLIVEPHACLSFLDCLPQTKVHGKADATATAVTAGDTLLWQTLASVAIPGFTINRTVHATRILVDRASKSPVSH